MSIGNFAIPLSLLVLVGSVSLDLLIGEPSESIHPVVWIGRVIGILKERFAGFGRDRLFGSLLVFVVILAAGGGGYLAVRFAPLIWPPLGFILAIYLLKATISIRSLLSTATQIGKKIDTDPEGARDELIALVGRDRSGLSKDEMRSATIESLFENLVDSIISPLFYFCLGSLFIDVETGIALALFFKALSTVDSMIGYRTESLMDFGFLGARLDDIMNWIPARISPLLISIGSLSTAPVRIALRDWNKTSSPNSGWSMSACSGALKVKLAKRSHYVLGSEFELPDSGEVSRANNLVIKTTAIYLLMLSGLIFLTPF